MGRELNKEFFEKDGVKYVASFHQVAPGHVIFQVTGKFDGGRKPKTVDSGKAHTKAEAMKWIKRDL